MAITETFTGHCFDRIRSASLMDCNWRICVTTSGSSTFVSRPSWQRLHISWVAPFAPLLLSLGLMDAATEGQPFSECVENCGP